MASITQTIPSYIGGISQQPDELMVPGQLNAAINVLPDLTEALTKRPGSKYITKLDTSTPTSKWFSYYRDDGEQYIGRITLSDGVIRMWKCSDGSEKTVVYDSTDETAIKNYLKTATVACDLQTLTLNDNTYITSRKKTVAMSDTNKTAAKPAEAFIELKNISYSSQYSLNLYEGTTLYDEYTATRLDIDVLIDSKKCGKGGVYGGNDDKGFPSDIGTLCGTRHHPTDEGQNYDVITGASYWDQQAGHNWATEDDDAMCPNIGTKVFSVDAGQAWPDPVTNCRSVGGINWVKRGNNYYANGEVHTTAWFEVANSTTYTVTVDPSGLNDVLTYTTDGSATFDELIAGLKADSDYDESKYTIQKAGMFYKPLAEENASRTARTNFQRGQVQIIFKKHYGSKSLSTISGTNSEAFAKQDHDGNTITVSDSVKLEDLYFRITCLGQSTSGGNANAAKYTCRYNYTIDLLHGGSGWKEGDEFELWFKNAKYKITVTKHSNSKIQGDLGMIRPTPTPFDASQTITAEQIIGDIRTAIIEADAEVATGATPPNAVAEDDWVEWDESNGYGIKQIGNGLYIKRKDATKFGISSPVGELLNVFSEAVDTIEDLPQQCRHGYVVKVSNSAADEDDYYLQFFGDNDKDGTGVWEECVAPNTQVQFDYSTLPVTLIRTADGNFRVSQVDGSTYTISGTQYTVPVWKDRLVGDTTNDPVPSFVGKEISKLLFFRNRFVFLSDENIILSQPGDFYNFWNKTALTFSVSDPIDLSCTSDKPAITRDAIQVNSGLIIFTETSQFMLTTDSDVLSPQTAKINFLSSYNFNKETNPISLGTTVGFLDNAGRNTRFFEAAQIRREGEPIVVEQTKVVSKLFNKNIIHLSNSRENSIILFSEDNKPTLYVYKYFTQGEKRIQASWFQWELSGNIQHHAIMDDALYLVVRNGTKDVLQRIDLKLHDSTAIITDDMDTVSTDDDVDYRIHLDNIQSVAIASNAYNSTTDKTTFTLPTGFNNEDKKIVVYDNSGVAGPSDTIGFFAPGTLKHSGSDVNLELPGDWSSNTVQVGYLFDMELEFPTIYRTQQSGESWRSDVQANLVIHRAKLNLGGTGSFDTILERRGKPDYTETWEIGIADKYRSNQVATTSITQTVPIYEKNTNLTLKLKASHPSPTTLYSMAWEGDYTSKYYRRV